MSWVKPRHGWLPIIKRAFDDSNYYAWNEQQGIAPGIIDDLNYQAGKPSYESYWMRPTKRRRVMRKKTVGMRKRKTSFRRKRRGSWKLRARRRVGHRLTKLTPTKTTTIAGFTNATPAPNALFFINCTGIGPVGFDRNDRRTDEVNVRGIKIHMYLENATGSRPHLFNMALVSPLGSEGINDVGGLTGTNFFRSNNEERGVDFPQGPFSNSVSSINTDVWNVMWRYRAMVLADFATRAKFKFKSWYHKVGREFRFEKQTDAVPDGENIFLIYWWSPLDGAPGGEDDMKLSLRVVNVWKETK